MKLLYELYFAMRNHKLLHYERYYIVTFNIPVREYCVWSVDSLGLVNLLTKCKDKLKLDFSWNILMGRSEVICP